MNGRIALLLVVCTLFAAVWRGDEPGRRADTRTSYRRYVGAEQYAAPEPGPSTFVTVAEAITHTPVESSSSVADVLPSTVVETDTRTADTVDLPLPFDITAGEYRVVGDHGEMHELVLTVDELLERGIPATIVEPRASYVVEVDGVTWYFVRVVPRIAGREAELQSRVEPTGPSPFESVAGKVVETFSAGIQAAQQSVGVRIAVVRSAMIGAFRRSSGRVAIGVLDSLERARTAMATTGATRN